MRGVRMVDSSEEAILDPKCPSPFPSRTLQTVSILRKRTPNENIAILNYFEFALWYRQDITFHFKFNINKGHPSLPSLSL